MTTMAEPATSDLIQHDVFHALLTRTQLYGLRRLSLEQAAA